MENGAEIQTSRPVLISSAMQLFTIIHLNKNLPTILAVATKTITSLLEVVFCTFMKLQTIDQLTTDENGEYSFHIQWILVFAGRALCLECLE